MRFFKSFKYAFRGIVYCINNERNMRIHTAAALYVFAFSHFFEITRTGYAVLLLTFALVMAAELFNTVAEEITDMIAASYHPVARIIKDLAAGGVLVCALFAVGVGIYLFWQPESFLRILRFFIDRPWRIAVFLASLIAAALYVIQGPIGIRDFCMRKKNENKEK
ncbi:MAG TPA: diacylglycerol kinase family protein [Candidatus Gallacutalibacter pullicola]|uniref:Diacylglycerol kinase family protein n=1 Tax=Candidatus Gallacutalibacter pullicola TaxID=2840830 RepID=A0A9D1DQ96_9FIRM|nr:diacylglycerol kinase family protein [Candidatus Gallacutalibacter pullicola]